MTRADFELIAERMLGGVPEATPLREDPQQSLVLA